MVGVLVKGSGLVGGAVSWGRCHSSWDLRERERRFDYMKMLKEGVLEGGSSINNHQAMTRRDE